MACLTLTSYVVIARVVAMHEATCVIFGAGEYNNEPLTIPTGALVVAADGGLDYLRKLGISADIAIGDFDSLQGDRPDDVGRTLVLPAEKDDPDMLSALKIGWVHGCRVFHIYGGLGGRLDHTIANIQLIALVAQRGGSAFLYGSGSVITAICDGELHFDADINASGRVISVFSHTDESFDVNEAGLKYHLQHAHMANTHVNGVSNEFLPGIHASVSVHRGTLIVTFPSEAPLPQATHFHEFEGDLGKVDTEVSAALAVPHDCQ